MPEKNNILGFNFFVSLFIFLVTLISVLFTRMEMKRKSYEIYKLSSDFKMLDDEYRTLYKEYSGQISDQSITSLSNYKIRMKVTEFKKVINIGSSSFIVKY